MKRIILPLIVALFCCFLTASISVAKTSILLENYAMVAEATWRQPFTNAHQMGLEASSGRIVLESDRPWGDTDNITLLTEYLDENELKGYAVPFVENGVFSVGDSYLFFDKFDSKWDDIGTITPKNGKTYVIFIPKPEVDSDSTASLE